MNSIKSNFESLLHEELGSTDEELRAELIAQGLDPDEEAENLRSMMNTLMHSYTAQHAQHAQHLSIRQQSAQHKRFAMFDEAVAAGHPAPSSFEPAQNVDLLELLHVANPESVIWARVSGWSMRDEGIRDGDFILVDTRQVARDGDIVLAHLAGDGQVVKRLRLKSGGTHGAYQGAQLESANPDFLPIDIQDPTSLTIHGVVIGRAGRL